MRNLMDTAGQTPALLYVDHDVELSRMVAAALDLRGYGVTTVHSSDDALICVQAGRFDLIALDHYMPHSDSLATLTRLLELTDDAVPVIYMTGPDDSRVAVAAIGAGAKDHIAKIALADYIELLDATLAKAMRKVRLRRERDAAELAVRDANQRLEAVVARQAVLLSEVNHRVANSLQLVLSLVHLQAAAASDPASRMALNDTENRIMAIMQVHRRLYTSDQVEVVEMSDYLIGLAAELSQSSPDPLAQRGVVVACDPLTLSPDKAVAVGVIVAELVINAFKYAYPPERPGEVRVIMRREREGRLKLIVEDDGAGMASDQTSVGTGLGRRVIQAMARSLGGDVAYDPAHKGTRAVICFMA